MGPLRRLSIFAFFALALPLSAQQGRISSDSDVRSAPGGTVVAHLDAGTTWATGATRAGFTSVTIEGWVDASRFASGRDSFPVTIGGSANLRIREQPSLQGTILGYFRAGAGMRIVERRDTWAKVRREVWVPSGSVAVQAAARPSTSASTPNRASPAASPQRPAAETAGATRAPDTSQAPASEPAGALRSNREVPLMLGPNGQVLAMLDSGIVVTPEIRERGWVRVVVQGWVPESHFVPADTSYGATLTAADLRADPVGHRGKLVRWEVQIVGLQTADPLRRDMTENEPFLLAIGPTGENATLYVTVPQALLAEARAISPLTTVMLTARVRTGRSNPTGAPILELVSLTKN